MLPITLSVASDGSLVIPNEVAGELGLVPNQTVVVERREGTIFVLPEPAVEQLLDELDGCLGEEPAEAYDFGRVFDPPAGPLGRAQASTV